LIGRLRLRRQNQLHAIVAKCPLDALRELRGPKSNKEFLIVVIGAGAKEKEFKVKQKHFERLPYGSEQQFASGQSGTQDSNPVLLVGLTVTVREKSAVGSWPLHVFPRRRVDRPQPTP
jgi:hypothetical protein